MRRPRRCIIEDKTGLKQNSLFGTDRVQVLEDIDVFCEKIKAGRAARKSEDFMVVARIEALIAGVGMEEALKRAHAYTEAGADGIMIHSRNKDPTEIFAFIKSYRESAGAKAKPIIVVPSSYNSVYESELQAAGVSVIIYANHLLRVRRNPPPPRPGPSPTTAAPSCRHRTRRCSRWPRPS